MRTNHGNHIKQTKLSTAATRMLALVGTALSIALLFAPTADARPFRSYAAHIDRTIMATRSESMGRQLATWYGPGFFGHGTACGGKLTPRTWGIAHRTLPCGTLVTLGFNGRTVTVPVIDRGPYSGATIDLTSRTKEYLHFTSGTVRMIRIKRYRVLPEPKPVAGIVAIPHAS